MKKLIVSALAGLALVSVAAFAYAHERLAQGMHGQGMGMQGSPGSGMQGGGHTGHGAPGSHAQSKGDAGPSSLAFQAVTPKMHQAMDINYTGNADVDFVRGMVPHHQSAVDLAKVVLTYGKDPQVKKLAQEIIAAQEPEIAQMQDWLKKNAK